MFHFGDNIAKGPAVLHECCNICSLTCKCNVCTPSHIELVPNCPPVRYLPLEKQHSLMKQFKAYRDSIVPAENLLFEVEIASGIPNCILEKVVNNALTANVDFIVKSGVQEVHAIAMYGIVVSLL